ncbi:MAG: hypothetical protein LBB38_02320, partial [Puniceicoccales bacterium]|nr:hypothetical protein [Puniceicoccales bacterium]
DGKNSFRRTICDIVLIRPLRVFFVTLVHVPAIQRKQTNATAAKVDPATAEVVGKPAVAADDEPESQGPAANVGKQAASTTPPIASTPVPAATPEVPPEDDAADVPAHVELSVQTVLPREHYDALRNFAELNLARIRQNMRLSNAGFNLQIGRKLGRSSWLDPDSVLATLNFGELASNLPDNMVLSRQECIDFVKLSVIASNTSVDGPIEFAPDAVCGVSLELAGKIAAACIGGDGKFQRAKAECFLALLVPEDCCRVTRSVLLALLANPQSIEDVLQEFRVKVLTAALLPVMQYADGNCGIISIIALIQLKYPRRMFAELKSLVEEGCIYIVIDGKIVKIAAMAPRKGHPCHLQGAWERTAMEPVRAAAPAAAAAYRRANPLEKDFVPLAVGGIENFDQEADAFGISFEIYTEIIPAYLGDGYAITRVYQLPDKKSSHTQDFNEEKTIDAIVMDEAGNPSVIGFLGGIDKHYLWMEKSTSGPPLVSADGCRRIGAQSPLQDICDAMGAHMLALKQKSLAEILGDNLSVDQFATKAAYHFGDHDGTQLRGKLLEYMNEAMSIEDLLRDGGKIDTWTRTAKISCCARGKELSSADTLAPRSMTRGTVGDFIIEQLIALDIVPIYIDRWRNFDRATDAGGGSSDEKLYQPVSAGFCCGFDGKPIPCTFFSTRGGFQCGSFGKDGGGFNYLYMITRQEHN